MEDPRSIDAEWLAHHAADSSVRRKTSAAGIWSFVLSTIFAATHVPSSNTSDDACELTRSANPALRSHQVQPGGLLLPP